MQIVRLAQEGGEASGCLRRGDTGVVEDVDEWCDRPYLVAAHRNGVTHWYREDELCAQQQQLLAAEEIETDPSAWWGGAGGSRTGSPRATPGSPVVEQQDFVLSEFNY